MAKKFFIKFKHEDDQVTCQMNGMPVIGIGSSPVEALQSFTRAIPDVYEVWAENLSLKHAGDTQALKVYKNLTYMVSNFSNDENSAIFYAPENP